MNAAVRDYLLLKAKTRYSCASAICFNLRPEIIMKNCEFDYYFNKIDVKPTVLDGRQF